MSFCLSNWKRYSTIVRTPTVLYYSFFRNRCSNDKNMRLLEIMLSFLLNCNASLSILITAFYWAVIFPPMSPDKKAYDVPDKVLGHGLVPILVLLDLVFFSTRDIWWRHFWQPLSVGGAYVAFSYAYYQLGGRGYVRYVVFVT